MRSRAGREGDAMTASHRPKLLPIVLALGLTLLVAGAVLAAGSSPVDGWAWATCAGRLDLAPDHGGVTVYDDRLEGDAWGGSIGWIRLGTHTGGSPHTYANDAADTYGVNHDGAGNLSGYAWGTNVGWIDFAPEHGGVTIDPTTGEFDGYAWGESIGWLRFRGPAYQVTTTWRALPDSYDHDTGELTDDSGPVSSGGLNLAADGFPAAPGDSILIGHNGAGFDGTVTDDLPAGVDVRWGRVWEIVVTHVSGEGGRVRLTFDISGAGGTGGFADGGTYALLRRATGSPEPFTVVTVIGDPEIVGDRITFVAEVEELGSEFTIGATADSSLGAPRFDIFLPLVVNQSAP